MGVCILAALKALLEERYGPRPARAPEHLGLVDELRKLPPELLREAVGLKDRKVIRMELRERAKAAGL